MRLSARLPEPWRRPWARTNHAGAPVTLLEGPVWVVGALAGLVVTQPGARGRAGALAVAAAGLGLLDDLAGSGTSKGLRGHLTALRRGEVTTGAIKLLGLGATGLATALAVDARGGRAGGARLSERLLSTLFGGGVVAGTANLVNLLDLRPGRALKSVVALAAPLALGSPAAAAAVGASLGVAADDLDARSMLGDTGANAAGALVGLAVVERCGPVGRAGALAVLTALTLASERVSFSAVIDRHVVLRRIDQWGRPAPVQAAPVQSATGSRPTRDPSP
ncbi:hypothetical protein N864_11390 [Intrasporangium chromatireducens Q5-1]|uniref:Glycosyl transferase n=1 Tax=Intrasporangium chromatireducens Q5-1 TaxID=584657 RepID=W9GKC1_9MICO|nr:hypothetical protein [Intrasporangium chromatireducens]EWT04344.1 hypothetical protein N864_11390 [Intrasporangium chromatireducens Q5-1]